MIKTENKKLSLNLGKDDCIKIMALAQDNACYGTSVDLGISNTFRKISETISKDLHKSKKPTLSSNQWDLVFDMFEDFINNDLFEDTSSDNLASIQTAYMNTTDKIGNQI